MSQSTWKRSRGTYRVTKHVTIVTRYVPCYKSREKSHEACTKVTRWGVQYGPPSRPTNIDSHKLDYHLIRMNKHLCHVIEALLLEASLPDHPFEENMLNTSETPRLQATIHFSNLVEVFVDAFIGATNNISKEHLGHFSRAILFRVHSIFPPPEVSGHHGKDHV